jgi:multidrug transporter EmrE-like cation transporter
VLSLALAVACSASIVLLFRRSERLGANRYAVTGANYVAAAVAGVALIAARGGVRVGEAPLAARLDEITRSLGDGARLSVEASPVWAVLVGLVAGGLFFLAFLVYQVSVRDHGVGLAGSFAKLGILLPTGLSLVVWREAPGIGSRIGMGLAVAALLCVHLPTGPGARRAVRPALLLLFLLGGCAEFANRVFQRHGLQADKALFLTTTFGVAFVVSLVALAVTRRSIARRDVLLGLAVGVPNFFSSFFLIRALETVPASAAFALYGAGTILVLAVVGALVLRERTSRAERIAIVATVAAVVLVALDQ